MTMITPSYLGETIEYSSLHACRSTLEDPTCSPHQRLAIQRAFEFNPLVIVREPLLQLSMMNSPLTY